MAAFTLIPKKIADSAYRQKIVENFLQRGFSDPEMVDAGNYSLLCFGGIANGKPSTLWKDEKGNFLFIAGNFIEKGKLNRKGSAELFTKIRNGKLEASEITGTFCIITYDSEKKNLNILHDANGVFRFYTDRVYQTVSSSFSVLVKAADKSDFDYDIIRFNLIFGFNPAYKTWVKSVSRVLKPGHLPEDIAYSRIPEDTRKWVFKSEKSAVEAAVSLLESRIRIYGIEGESLQKYLGLSSGYDSRLMAALLNKAGLDNLSFFTFNKPGAADPVIALEIARLSRLPLIKIETGRLMEYAEQERVYQNAFRFFDGHAVTMMQYSKPDYTAEFRREIFDAGSLHLSGVGGELFRNYNFDHKVTTSVDSWVGAYLLNGLKLVDYVREDKADAVMELFEAYLKEELGVFEKINFAERKRYYGELFLRDWHSVRNSVESQYSFYYTPFTDQAVINLSYGTAKYHGTGGRFEGQLINAIHPALASIQSGYGYPLNQYPKKAAFMNGLRAFIKRPVMIPFQKTVQRNNKYQPTPFEMNQLAILDALDLGVNRDTFLSSSKRVEPFLATAYSLNQLINL